MLNRFFQCVVVTACLASGNVDGQSCGTNFGAHHPYGGGTNCGREISQGDAMALWGDYCHETCFDFRRQRQRCGKGGGSCFSFGGYGAGCGCNDGFAGGSAGRQRAGFLGNHFHQHRAGGQPIVAGGCGADFVSATTDCGVDRFTSGHRGQFGCLGHFGRRHSLNLCGAGRDQCGGCFLSRLFHRHRGQRAGGCGLFRHLHGNGPGLFATSAANCGTNGAYFSEAVGYEYGTGGIQSAVIGSGSPAANTSIDGSYGDSIEVAPKSN